MKKRFLTATLAAICAVSSLSATAFATAPDEVTSVATDDSAAAISASAGTGTTSVTAYTSVPDFNVTLPANLTYIVNPYQLKVSVDGVPTQETVLSPDIKVLNNGNGKIAVKAEFKLNTAAPTGVTIVDGINKLNSTDTKAATVDTKTTDKTIQLFLEPATAKTDSKTGVTSYTYAGKYNSKNCELLFASASLPSDSEWAAATPGDKVNAFNAAKAVKPATNVLLTLAPGSKVATGKYEFVDADFSAWDGDWGTGSTGIGVANGSYVLAKGKTQADLDALIATAAGEVTSDSATTSPTRAAVAACVVANTSAIGLEADISAVDSTITGVTGKYLAAGKTQTELDTAIAALNTKGATDNATELAAVNALLKAETDVNAATQEIYEPKPTEGRIKVSGSVNTNAQWAAADKVPVTIAWHLERVVNDIEKTK